MPDVCGIEGRSIPEPEGVWFTKVGVISGFSIVEGWIIRAIYSHLWQVIYIHYFACFCFYYFKYRCVYLCRAGDNPSLFIVYLFGCVVSYLLIICFRDVSCGISLKEWVFLFFVSEVRIFVVLSGFGRLAKNNWTFTLWNRIIVPAKHKMFSLHW